MLTNSKQMAKIADANDAYMFLSNWLSWHAAARMQSIGCKSQNKRILNPNLNQETIVRAPYMWLIF